MKIVHIITRLIVGGAQENTIASVLGLRNRPHLNVDLISGPTSGPEGSLETQVVVIPGLLKIVPKDHVANLLHLIRLSLRPISLEIDLFFDAGLPEHVMAPTGALDETESE